MIEFRFGRRNLKWKEKIKMLRSHQLIATCFAIIALGPTMTATRAEIRPSNGGDVDKITELQPFTHVSYIPAGSSISSIRIENIKLVKVPTKRRIVRNDDYCNQPWSEPGGSMECQRITDELPVTAYRVTYSYRGQPLASDECGNTYFTFSVYFRPAEIGPRLREMVALGKVRRGDREEFFELTTSRQLVQQTVIDSAKSVLCDGNYIDGNWTRTNPKCEDRLAYKTVTGPSPYIAVRVDPVPSRVETALAREQK